MSKDDTFLVVSQEEFCNWGQCTSRPSAHTTIEEIPGGEVVTAAMFLVNQHPAVVLFDSGASHSFLSQAFASKHGQHVVDIDKGKFCISAAGNQISTNQLVRNVHFAIEGRNYSADLVILPSLGIDVILGMNWMSGHGVLIHTSTRVGNLIVKKLS